jgi:predicted nucleic acid-binding protein
MSAGSSWPAALLDWSAYARVVLAHTRPGTGRRLSPDAIERFEDALQDDRLSVCPPFRLEALYSARTKADFSALSEELEGFCQAPGDAATWLLAEQAQRELAEKHSVSHRVAPADLLTAAIASQHGLGVLHYDNDYDLIAGHTSLDFESVWIAPPGSAD